MNRRLLLATAACWPLGAPRAQDEPPRPRHKISAAQLHEALSARFPVRFALAGVLELQVSAPSLLLRPVRNQLGATLLAQLSGRQLQAAQSGDMDVVFTLRYEPVDQTIRARDLEILALRWPGMPPETRRLLQGLLPQVARDAVGEFVLHQLTPRDLALADTMGFAPEQLTVVEDGLVILFGPKRKPSPGLAPE